MYWLLLVSGRHCIPNFTYVSAYVVTTQAGQLSARTFQRSISCRPASKAHAMEAHRACNAVHWRVAPTGHARAARKKRTRLAKMAKIGIFNHSTDNFSASRPSTPFFVGAFRYYGGSTLAGEASTKCDEQIRNTVDYYFICTYWYMYNVMVAEIYCRIYLETVRTALPVRVPPLSTSCCIQLTAGS